MQGQTVALTELLQAILPVRRGCLNWLTSKFWFIFSLPRSLPGLSSNARQRQRRTPNLNRPHSIGGSLVRDSYSIIALYFISCLLYTCFPFLTTELDEWTKLLKDGETALKCELVIYSSDISTGKTLFTWYCGLIEPV